MFWEYYLNSNWLILGAVSSVLAWGIFSLSLFEMKSYFEGLF